MKIDLKARLKKAKYAIYCGEISKECVESEKKHGRIKLYRICGKHSGLFVQTVWHHSKTK